MIFREADGWECCSMHDPSGRRGVWYRRTPDGGLEVRAGREGDDEHCTIPPCPVADALAGCLRVGAWMLEQGTECQECDSRGWIDDGMTCPKCRGVRADHIVPMTYAEWTARKG